MNFYEKTLVRETAVPPLYYLSIDIVSIHASGQNDRSSLPSTRGWNAARLRSEAVSLDIA